MKLSSATKANIRNASIFILGVIVTIIITKASDKVVPNDPVIVKQVTDTIRLVHDYNLPQKLEDDTIKKELEAKIKNIELLNDYDKQIKERISRIQESNNFAPNLIVTQNVENIAFKGYTYGNSSPYFSSECPDINSKFLDIRINFLNPSIVKDVAYLRVNIYKFDGTNKEEAMTYVLEDFYEVKPNDNLIRVNNDLVSGKYQIIYGFMFKNDMKEQYPRFYFKKCILYKK